MVYHEQYTLGVYACRCHFPIDKINFNKGLTLSLVFLNPKTMNPTQKNALKKVIYSESTMPVLTKRNFDAIKNIYEQNNVNFLLVYDFYETIYSFEIMQYY